MGFFTRAKRAALPDRIELSVAGLSVPVRVRTHPNARRYTLRVGRAGAEPVITVPSGGSLRGAEAFLDRHRFWLLRRLEARPPTQPFAPGIVIPFRGVPHMIVHRPGMRGLVTVETGVDGPALVVAGPIEHLPRRLTDWFKRQAKTDLEIAVFRYAAMVDGKPTALRLRDQKGRWGSCSSRGTLSFSWRLILAPPMVLDYLAAHEVTHLREMNHSARFWTLLRRICPDTDRAEAWLKANGGSLHAIGVATADGPAPAVD